ncbi:eCIS core domain-containing protein [Tenacibaculum sp. M341]|uniref:eCIS core domain-containing protein n=1 Tax=Tenacibaculum sp. M341 TaxID=2530339 RepID=UPI0010488284|nr:DUF4157 domain-containing protein [Tenacibaculum sp. M341]TCI90675.1 DUF4157 domain-containing protein [Tenacibaculum sp. M341]
MRTYPKKSEESKKSSAGYSNDQKDNNNEASFQFQNNRPEVVAQMKLQDSVDSRYAGKDNLIQKKENKTGLPDNLKIGIENLSGYSMDDVKVHYNSSKPTQLRAHAYAQGTNIHVASGQERHLAHEAWHVVQQKQGRVKPTLQMKGGVNVNDDSKLEREADVMGDRALRGNHSVGKVSQSTKVNNTGAEIAQMQWINDDNLDYFKWDTLIEGVRWFSAKDEDLMYFLIEKPKESKRKYKKHQGIANAKPRADWVALHGSDPLAEEDATVSDVNDRPFIHQGGGMDKKYFWNGGEYGWLETSPEVIEREFKAYEALSSLNITLPRLIMTDGPTELRGKDGGSLGAPQNGYWIQHVPMDKTYKPAMMWSGTSMDFKRLLRFLPAEAKASALRGLNALKPKVDGISNIVGEFTLAIHQYTGEVYLLDFAPDASGKVGGDDLARNAKLGLDNMTYRKKK